MTLESNDRTAAAAVTLGLAAEGCDVRKIGTLATELIELRLVLTNIAHLTVATDAPLDVQRVEDTITTINRILGDRDDG